MFVTAACHVHSNWSYDGSWSLEALAAEFARRGYRVVMVTEHDRGFTESRQLRHREACAQASSEKILVLPGIEYSDASNLVHILVWGPVPFLGEGLPTSALLNAVKTSNGVAVLAHPSRRGAWKSFDPAWAENLLGIELWNRKTDGWAPSRQAAPLLKSTGVLPFVGMDFHEQRHLFPLTMMLELSLPVSEHSVLDCLRSRHCCAHAFGVPAAGLFLSMSSVVLNSAEWSRRILARCYRQLMARRDRERSASR